jgi:hypothetical protein
MLRALPVLLSALLPSARDADEPAVPTVKVAVAAATRPAPRALRYPLLPDPLELTPGNAAIHWLRAGRAAVAAPSLTNEQYQQWLGDRPLAELPRDEVRKYLDRCQAALRAAERAALCERCDWEMPPLTLQMIGEADAVLVDVQAMRALAALLSLQCRLQLREADYDGAARSLQTGLTLSRHLGQGPTLIQTLVGMALAGVMQARIEEWVATPGSPNLYWSLTALPRPFFDLRPVLRNELGTLYRSYPALRRLAREKVSARQMEALAEEVARDLARAEDRGDHPLLAGKAAVAAVAARLYPDARKALLAAGEKADDVEAMPALQVVFVYLLTEYDRLNDDILKWLSLPYWQGRAGLARVEQELNGGLLGPGSFLFGGLYPAVLKVYDARTRLDRQLAALRCLEALRLYAAAHDGKLPAKLADVREAPPPLDPVSGQGFDDAYRRDGDGAVLELRPVEGKPAFQARRYLLTQAK